MNVDAEAFAEFVAPRERVTDFTLILVRGRHGQQMGFKFLGHGGPHRFAMTIDQAKMLHKTLGVALADTAQERGEFVE